MDATAGDGDPFWELYCDHFMQQPEQLTLPMCWDPELLQQLQHTAIIEAAQKQQVSDQSSSWLRVMLLMFLVYVTIKPLRDASFQQHLRNGQAGKAGYVSIVCYM